MSNLLQSAPKSMLYNLGQVPAIETATALRRFDASVTSGFSGAGQNEARIRISANDGFLDGNKSYLQFAVTTAVADCSIDGTAGSFIDRMEIQSNGRTVWRCDSYSIYHNLRKYYNSDLADVNKLTTNEGSRGMISQDDAAFAASSIHEVAMSGLGEVITTAHTKNYCLDLECGFFKNDLKKAIPQGTSVELVIRFKVNNGAIAADTGDPTWEINNVRFYAPVYSVLNAEATNFYNQMLSQGAVMWSGDYIKTYINALSTAGTTAVLQINDRSLSVNSFITVLREHDADTSLASLTNSAYTLLDAGGEVTSYEYSVAGQPLPASGRILIKIGGTEEDVGRAMEEATKCLVDNGKSHGKSMVTKAAFTSANTVLLATKLNATNIAKGVLALDLRKMDDMSLKLKGVNTANSASPNTISIEHTSFTTAKQATTFAVCCASWRLMPNGELEVSV
tara:strand:+ start:112 stop:1464 length:1353 start_codon:yes stop_codon:yes gene_type:complete